MEGEDPYSMDMLTEAECNLLVEKVKSNKTLNDFERKIRGLP